MKKIIDAQKWVLGMSLNKETFSKLEEAVENLEIDPVLFSGAIRQAVTQGLLDGDTALAKQKLNEVRVQMYSLRKLLIVISFHLALKMQLEQTKLKLMKEHLQKVVHIFHLVLKMQQQLMVIVQHK